MNTLIITVGLPGAGKSAWARKQYGIPIVNPDSIRLATHGHYFIQQAEHLIWAMTRIMVEALFLAGHHKVILDATSTTKRRRAYWSSQLWQVRYKFIDTPQEECKERILATGRTDLVDTMERMAARMDPLGPDDKLYDEEGFSEPL